MTNEATVTTGMVCDEHHVRTILMCALNNTKENVDQDIQIDVPIPVNCTTVVMVLLSLWTRPV